MGCGSRGSDGTYGPTTSNVPSTTLAIHSSLRNSDGILCVLMYASISSFVLAQKSTLYPRYSSSSSSKSYGLMVDRLVTLFLLYGIFPRRNSSSSSGHRNSPFSKCLHPLHWFMLLLLLLSLQKVRSHRSPLHPHHRP